MGQAERIQERPDIAAETAVRYGSRGVPADWFLDPADPEVGERYREDTRSALDDQATAFLATHGALSVFSGIEDRPSSLLVLPGAAISPLGLRPHDLVQAAPVDQPVRIGLPLAPGSVDDEGELSWQADALCAQTDPEAFFPEKGGSTRDAKKVCGSCIVKSECLEYALEKDERFGIWGGMSERERRRLRKSAG
ncbi:WhiB family transcriptional regulator [Arthrobacter echini]|uniref:Transcriptional regulator WhiB n=1 Tax=Arthrobacter echini TaxID=1529066 RepID=A0A5D0XR92_9MICC|nr:WhiB family transcriptional regulator [Arthrobacter echini]TYC98966.1 WhiB family transcriptional regulator [Arthrobacter echini]